MLGEICKGLGQSTVKTGISPAYSMQKTTGAKGRGRLRESVPCPGATLSCQNQSDLLHG